MRLKNIFIKTSILIILCGILCTKAIAEVKFLPASDSNSEVFRVPIENPCTGYVMESPNCEGKKCEEGWVCSSCSNSLGTFYKCEEAKTPRGYTAGITSCEPCNEYLHKGFTGNLINGRCIPIEDCSENAVDDSYVAFEYISGVEVGDTEITYIEKTGHKKINQ